MDMEKVVAFVLTVCICLVIVFLPPILGKFLLRLSNPETVYSPIVRWLVGFTTIVGVIASVLVGLKSFVSLYKLIYSWL